MSSERLMYVPFTSCVYGVVKKSKNLMETDLSVEPPLHELNCGHNVQNLDKSRYQGFLFLSGFTWFSYFVSYISFAAEGEMTEANYTWVIFWLNESLFCNK